MKGRQNDGTRDSKATHGFRGFYLGQLSGWNGLFYWTFYSTSSFRASVSAEENKAAEPLWFNEGETRMNGFNRLGMWAVVALLVSGCSDSNSELGTLLPADSTALEGDATPTGGMIPGTIPIGDSTDAPDSAGDSDGNEPDGGLCVPSCDDKNCGDDGCDGTCGACDLGFVCGELGQCQCEPDCSGKLCGDDSCGSVCGTCSTGTTCDASGHCICVASCEGLECGTDGCGGDCGACTDVQICSEAGQCIPDPEAGCAGLGLAESWSGTFEGNYEAGVFGFPATDGDTTGDLSFELECLPSKVLLTGQIVGVASGQNPFSLTLAGSYNPDTGVMEGQIPDGSLSLEDLTIEIVLAGELPGSLQPDGTLSGTYSVTATAATSILGPIDMNDVNAGSDGSWTASPNP